MMFDDTMNLLQMFQPAGKDSSFYVFTSPPPLPTPFYEEKIRAGWNVESI